MSFFAGRIGTKTVLSLNKASGGDVNVHNTPNGNTIFHSDMPHLFVKTRYKVNLGSGGDGYYIGTLPTELITLLANRANVILPILVCRDSSGTEFYHQMVGMSRASSYLWHDLDLVGVSCLYGGSLSFDLNLEWGYYKASSGVSVADRIGVAGTGGYTIFNVEAGEDYDPAYAFDIASGATITGVWAQYPYKRTPNRNWLPRGSNPYTGNIRDMEKNFLINPDYMYPLGPSSSTYDTVFVRAGGARNLTGIKNTYAGTTASSVRNIDYYANSIPDLYATVPMSKFVRAGIERHVRNGLISGFTEATYSGMTPVRMEYLVLNVTFSNTGGYTAQNLFTGGEIKISRSDFTIKGVNLRSTSYEMLSAVSTGTPSISNTYFCSNTQASSATSLPDGGAFRLYGTSSSGGGGSWAASNVETSIGSTTQWNIGLYKFPTNSSIEINSSGPKVAINGTDIWSPSVRPLQLFTSDKASNITIGDNEWLYEIATGGTKMISSVSMGLPASGTTVVLMSIEWMGNDLCSPNGDPSMSYLWSLNSSIYSPAGVSKRLTKFDYDKGDGVSHQILVLNPNVYVPIYTENSFSYSGASSSSGGKPKSRFQYYIRKNGSTGNLEFWGTSRATPLTVGGVSTGKPPYIQFPKLRLNIQRLT